MSSSSASDSSVCPIVVSGSGGVLGTSGVVGRVNVLGGAEGWASGDLEDVGDDVVEGEVVLVDLTLTD